MLMFEFKISNFGPFLHHLHLLIIIILGELNIVFYKPEVYRAPCKCKDDPDHLAQ